ncbi:MAG: hypothetical protein ACC609_07280 [Methanobacterium formicicum]
MTKCHDIVTDQTAIAYNVGWVRSTLTIVMTGGLGGNSTEWADAFLNTARFIKDQGTKMVNGI